MARSTRKKENVELPPELAPIGRELSDLELNFVTEYLVDRDPHAAAARSGVARIEVKRKVARWMSDVDILRAIKLRTDTASLDKMISEQRIIAGYIDIAFDRSASHAARVSALRELAAFKKMGTTEDDKPKSGVMLVPMGMTMDQFKAHAMAQQKKLKDEVRD